MSLTNTHRLTVLAGQKKLTLPEQLEAFEIANTAAMAMTIGYNGVGREIKTARATCNSYQAAIIEDLMPKMTEAAHYRFALAQITPLHDARAQDYSADGPLADSPRHPRHSAQALATLTEDCKTIEKVNALCARMGNVDQKMGEYQQLKAQEDYLNNLAPQMQYTVDLYKDQPAAVAFCTLNSKYNAEFMDYLLDPSAVKTKSGIGALWGRGRNGFEAELRQARKDFKNFDAFAQGYAVALKSQTEHAKVQNELTGKLNGEYACCTEYLELAPKLPTAESLYTSTKTLLTAYPEAGAAMARHLGDEPLSGAFTAVAKEALYLDRAEVFFDKSRKRIGPTDDVKEAIARARNSVDQTPLSRPTPQDCLKLRDWVQASEATTDDNIRRFHAREPLLTQIEPAPFRPDPQKPREERQLERSMYEELIIRTLGGSHREKELEWGRESHYRGPRL